MAVATWKVGALGQQVADLAQERLVGRGVDGLAAARPVPGVDLGLQLVALLEQRAVRRGEVMHDRVEPRPEFLGRDPGPGNASSLMNRSRISPTCRPPARTRSDISPAVLIVPKAR